MSRMSRTSSRKEIENRESKSTNLVSDELPLGRGRRLSRVSLDPLLLDELVELLRPEEEKRIRSEVLKNRSNPSRNQRSEGRPRNGTHHIIPANACLMTFLKSSLMGPEASLLKNSSASFLLSSISSSKDSSSAIVTSSSGSAGVIFSLTTTHPPRAGTLVKE
jgi:hypothetical protein